jgi:hypothetical protein
MQLIQVQAHAADPSTPALTALFLSDLARFSSSVNFAFLSLGTALMSFSLSRFPLEVLEPLCLFSTGRGDLDCERELLFARTLTRPRGDGERRSQLQL